MAAIQTGTLGRMMTYLPPATLAQMAAALLAGRRAGGLFETPRADSLRGALTAGITDPDMLLQACADDTALEFGVRITDFGVLGYSPRVVIVGFLAQTVAGSGARLASRDPFWALWPWGRVSDLQDRAMLNWARGVTDMLNSDWGQAIDCLQAAARELKDIAGTELFWLRRALASNITLAVQYSHK